MKLCGVHRFLVLSKGVPSKYFGTSRQSFSGYTPSIVPAVLIRKRVGLSTPYYNAQLNRRAVPLRGTEMIPQYAYDGEPTIYLRRTARLPGLRTGLPTTSPTPRGDTIGHVYKFYTSECEAPIPASLITSSALG